MFLSGGGWGGLLLNRRLRYSRLLDGSLRYCLLWSSGLRHDWLLRRRLGHRLLLNNRWWRRLFLNGGLWNSWFLNDGLRCRRLLCSRWRSRSLLSRLLFLDLLLPTIAPHPRLIRRLHINKPLPLLRQLILIQPFRDRTHIAQIMIVMCSCIVNDWPQLLFDLDPKGSFPLCVGLCLGRERDGGGESAFRGCGEWDPGVDRCGRLDGFCSATGRLRKRSR